MKVFNLRSIYSLLLPVAVLIGTGSWAANPDGANSRVQVTVTVSGTGKQNPPRLRSHDVMVFEDNQRRPVLDLTPVSTSAQGSDLAILIDGSLASQVALQFDDVRAFIGNLPASTMVGVAYAEYGSARFAQNFTADRQTAQAALRIPEGAVNVGGSIYQSVADLARLWPTDGRSRSVLVISDGLDINRGLSETLPTLNPDLADAISQAQRANLTVYAIYAGGATGLTRDLFLLNNGQSSLTRLAFGTGGEAYFQGSQTPVAFSPFLRQVSDRLSQQYTLTFEAANTVPGSLRVTTEIPHVRLEAPARVWVSESK
jgi:hypothetical protein